MNTSDITNHSPTPYLTDSNAHKKEDQEPQSVPLRHMLPYAGASACVSVASSDSESSEDTTSTGSKKKKGKTCPCPPQPSSYLGRCLKGWGDRNPALLATGIITVGVLTGGVGGLVLASVLRGGGNHASNSTMMTNTTTSRPFSSTALPSTQTSKTTQDLDGAFIENKSSETQDVSIGCDEGGTIVTKQLELCPAKTNCTAPYKLGCSTVMVGNEHGNMEKGQYTLLKYKGDDDVSVSQSSTKPEGWDKAKRLELVELKTTTPKPIKTTTSRLSTPSESTSTSNITESEVRLVETVLTTKGYTYIENQSNEDKFVARKGCSGNGVIGLQSLGSCPKDEKCKVEYEPDCNELQVGTGSNSQFTTYVNKQNIIKCTNSNDCTMTHKDDPPSGDGWDKARVLNPQSPQN